MITLGLLAWSSTGFGFSCVLIYSMWRREYLGAPMIFWILGLGLICGPWMVFGLVREARHDNHD